MFSSVPATTTFDAPVATESALQEGPITAPLTTYAAPVPEVEYIAPAPAVTHATPAPVIEYVTPEPEAENTAPAPVCEYVAPAPEVECIAPVLVAKAAQEPVNESAVEASA